MNIEISPKEYEKLLNWYDSKLYCELIIDNKNDWRLPTKEELNEIYNSENDFDGAYYWSSTPHYENHAWSQHFANGYHGNYTKFASLYVRPVRTIEPSLPL